MRAFILSLPGRLQVTFIIGATILIAFGAAALLSLFFDEHQLVTNTDLISCVYEVMGTIYAILLTFTLWGVWQSFTEAGNSVRNEAYALLDLVHMAETYSLDKGKTLRQAALAYTKIVIEQEWPTLKSFTKSIINLHDQIHSSSMQVIQTVQNIMPQNERETVMFREILALLVRWLDARRTRILIAGSDSAQALWPLLFTGAFVLFAFHGLFVAKTIGIWITLLFGTSLVIGVTFYLIFSLDCPFTGSLSIDAEPFVLATNLLKKNKTEE